MSYALSGVLQTALFEALVGDAAVQTHSRGHVYDAPPPGQAPKLYVLIGAETVRDAGDGTGDGAWHDVVVSIFTNTDGFLRAKRLGEAVSGVLHDAPLALSQGTLVSLRFHKARIVRAAGGVRRVEMTFRARIAQ